MKRLTESIPLNTIRPSHWLFQRDCRIEIRGGGMPYSNLALNADRKNGPAARSFAADAHDRIMVRINRSYRIQVCSTKMCPNGELPSDSQQTDRHAKSPSRSSSSLRVLRRQGAAKHKLARRQAAKLCYRFGPLTPSARSANLIAGDGTKNGFSAPNKEPTTNQNYDLTAKAPYRFESVPLQQPVRRELGPGSRQLRDDRRGFVMAPECRWPARRR